jgi:conjugative transfer region lipoprotein (TIGR03751 family)
MATQLPHRHRFLWISLGLLGAALAAGCATSQKAILPEDGPTMLQIYRQHMQRANQTSLATARARLASRPHDAAKTKASKSIRTAKANSKGQHRIAAAHVRAIHHGAVDLAGYTRSAYREDRALFPRLANPTLVMYVFPHLAAGGVGVPGYATLFPMYTHVIYALPGERTELPRHSVNGP